MIKLPNLTGPQAVVVAAFVALAGTVLVLTWWMIAHDKDPSGILATTAIGALVALWGRATAVAADARASEAYVKGKSEMPPAPEGTTWLAVPSIRPPAYPSDFTESVPSGATVAPPPAETKR